MASRNGTIKKQKNGKWRALWIFAGGKSKSKTFNTKYEAQDFLIKYRSLYGDSDNTEHLVTLVDVFPLYLEQRQKQVLLREIKESTLIREETTFKNRIAKSPIGNTYLKDLKADMLQNFLYDIAIKHSVSEASRHTYPLLVHMLKFAFLREWLKKPIYDLIRKPSKAINPPKQIIPYTVDEYNKMYKASVELWEEKKCAYTSLGYFLMCQTGMRTGELLALTLDNIDLDNRLILVNKSLNETKDFETGKKVFTIGTTKTTHSVRYIGLNDEAANIITEIMERNRQRNIISKYLLCKDNGDFCTISMMRRAITTVIECAKVRTANCLLHSARHYYATRLAELGISDRERMLSLGHTSYTTTLGYTYNDTKEQAERMKGYNINGADEELYNIDDNYNDNVIDFTKYLEAR